MLTWWIVGTWGATAVGGVMMTALFLRHRGMEQSEREAVGPRRVLPHIGFAVTGFGLWVAYAVSDVDALGWAALAALAVAFLIAGTFILTRDQHRRADLARIRGRTVPPIAGAAMDAPPTATRPAPGVTATATTSAEPAIPAEHFIPIWMASGHGLVGGTTLVLVLLERAGVS